MDAIGLTTGAMTTRLGTLAVPAGCTDAAPGGGGGNTSRGLESGLTAQGVATASLVVLVAAGGCPGDGENVLEPKRTGGAGETDEAESVRTCTIVGQGGITRRTTGVFERLTTRGGGVNDRVRDTRVAEPSGTTLTVCALGGSSDTERYTGATAMLPQVLPAALSGAAAKEPAPAWAAGGSITPTRNGVACPLAKGLLPMLLEGIAMEARAGCTPCQRGGETDGLPAKPATLSKDDHEGPAVVCPPG